VDVRKNELTTYSIPTTVDGWRNITRLCLAYAHTIGSWFWALVSYTYIHTHTHTYTYTYTHTHSIHT
jgi:hypothetical protein